MIKTGVLIPDHAPSELHSLKKLAAGRFTLVVANLDELKNANYLMKQAGVTDSVQLAFEMESSGTFLGFSTSHPKSAAAIKSFNAGMALIKKNGTLNKILMTWKSKLSD
jgi:ABC-type amino acid transport substrate-binding protein